MILKIAVKVLLMFSLLVCKLNLCYQVQFCTYCVQKDVTKCCLNLYINQFYCLKAVLFSNSFSSLFEQERLSTSSRVYHILRSLNNLFSQEFCIMLASAILDIRVHDMIMNLQCQQSVCYANEVRLLLSHFPPYSKLSNQNSAIGLVNLVKKESWYIAGSNDVTR